MLYISISSLENVKLVSGLLYKLSVVSTENLSTQYYCHWLVHPKNNEVELPYRPPVLEPSLVLSFSCA